MMNNRFTFWMLNLLLFLVVILTVRENVVVVVVVESFSTVPRNRIRCVGSHCNIHRSQSQYSYNQDIIHQRRRQSEPSSTSSTILSLSETTATNNNNNNNNNNNIKKKNQRLKQKRRKKRSPNTKFKKESIRHGDIEIWRIYGVSVHPDSLQKDEQESTSNPTTNKNTYHNSSEPPNSLQRALIEKLNLESIPSDTRIVRRSLDARKKLDNPVYNYVVDIPIQSSMRYKLRWKAKSGSMEQLRTIHSDDAISTKEEEEKIQTLNENDLKNENEHDETESQHQKKKTVVVIGMGPAGLFCAFQLALKSNGKIRTILLDRGQPVEKRGRDIGALINRRKLNEDSNFAFGEGGAGTWSDGKLTTRIGRNSETVRWVLETLVEFGAPANILWKGAPHLGTDNLVKLLRNMRHRLVELGGEIHFGTKMTNLKMEGNKVVGVLTEDMDGNEHCYEGDEFVLATGHSARDVYESLHKADVQLEPKGFAVGFRIEHPQAVINKIQYGDEWGPCVKTGKGLTDKANEEYFGSKSEHIAKMPVPSYRLATDKALDGVDGNVRGAYSFCMCPGGQIVLSSTNPEEMCVNGMSFSRRDSKWANSALVVTVSPDDEILKEYKTKHGVMAGLEFQREMERKAAELGGGNLTVPVQRMTDFVDGKISSTIPSSSYRLGVISAPCHEIYPEAITHALRDALTNHFQKQMPGYFHPDGLLHAVETRTSSPLRVARDPMTLLAIGTDNLYPSGEGAGYAGGIVSAAVDGVHVGEAILDNICGDSRPNRIEKSKSIGFSY